MSIILSFILFFSVESNPPGTIKIKDYYVDKTEILNIHWLEFIHQKSKELNSEEIKEIIPDSSNTWYALPSNRYKPIVLITYEQTEAYCSWRSEMVSRRTGRKVTYRLPTPAEWKEIAGEVLQWDLKQVEKELRMVHRKVEKNSGRYLLLDRINPKERIYDIFWNVSEMTLEKGIAMGSNNNELAALQTNLIREFYYSSVDKFIGFRCVAEVE